MSLTELTTSPQKQSFQKRPSFSDVAELINEKVLYNIKRGAQFGVRLPLFYGKYMASTISKVTQTMQTSKGRDKICSLIQYISDFYHNCHKNSNIELVKLLFQEGQYVSVIIAGKIKDSMKNGRKIFKFLKFLEEIKAFQKLIKSKKPIPIKILQFVCITCRVFYYFLDNILWGINIGMLSELIRDDKPKKVKNVKDTFSLIKGILQLIISHFTFQMDFNKEKKIYKQILQSQNKIMEEHDECYQYCIQMIEHRKKMREETIKITITILRIAMLIKRLKIPPLNTYIDGIFYSLAGLICTIVGLIKDNLNDNEHYNDNLKILNPHAALTKQQDIQVERKRSISGERIIMTMNEALRSEDSGDDKRKLNQQVKQEKPQKLQFRAKSTLEDIYAMSEDYEKSIAKVRQNAIKQSPRQSRIKK